MKPVRSALPTLTPHRIVNTRTGEIITWETYKTQALTPLIAWVHAETSRLYGLDPEQVQEDAANLKNSPAEYARQKGYRAEYGTLPREIKAKSRLEKLVQFNLITQTASYVRNPDPKKQEHRFSRTVNLGAVDKQMCTLEREGNTLILTWACWDQKYELSFTIPTYVLNRNISKWSLPVVSNRGFIFTVEESPEVALGENVAGVDLGRVQPYTLVITTPRGGLLAEYRANPQVQRVNAKRERILVEVKHISKKIEVLDSLGLDSAHLRREATLKRNKSARLAVVLKNQLAADLIKKATRHNVQLINLEDLRWVTGKRYGSKWAHGLVTEKTEHTAARHGVKTKRVNPRGSSQTCHKCGTKITHSVKTRTVWCGECKSRLDRDVNAALNIAKAQNKYIAQPESRVLVGTGRALLQPVVSNPISVCGSLNLVT